jgi:hypothetical protein
MLPKKVSLLQKGVINISARILQMERERLIGRLSLSLSLLPSFSSFLIMGLDDAVKVKV